MAPTDNMTELGSTGLHRNGGVVYEEFLPELRGDRWLKVVREMSEQDSIVSAFLLAIEMLLRQVDWEVSPGVDNDKEAQDAAQFVEECLQDMSLSWEDTLSEILTMLPYGYAYMEQIYKRRNGPAEDGSSKYNDGKIGWRKWAIRAQDSRYMWEFDETGGIKGFWQSVDGSKPVLIPIEKALLFRTSARKGNPEGKSLLRGAYRSYYFKKQLENIEGIGVERDLAGLPVAKVPVDILLPTANPGQQSLLAEIKKIITGIRRDEQEGVVWPLAYDEKGNETYKLELLSSGGARQFDTGAIIARYNAQIAMSALADFIMLGHENVGSYSLSATKSSLFKTALKAWLDSIADVINTHAIPRLLRVNGMAVDSPPKLQFSAVGEVELGDLVQFITATSGAGMELFPSTEVENALRGMVRLPLLTKEEIAERTERAQRESEAAAQSVVPQVPPTQPAQGEPTLDNVAAAIVRASERALGIYAE